MSDRPITPDAALDLVENYQNTPPQALPRRIRLADEMCVAVESLAAQVGRLTEDAQHLRELRIAISNDLSDAKAQLARFRALLLDVAASGVEHSDPRIDYCTVQVDTDTCSASTRSRAPWPASPAH